MLQNYKEEVDTLNEALKIAAMDIAEVAEAEEDFLSDDDDEASGSVSYNQEKPLGTERDADRNKDELYKLARGDNFNAPQKYSTFVVHSDGTFEHK